MSASDLPLFTWKPPCQVLVFPLINRIGKVRHTAGILFSKRGDDADCYWKKVVSANRKHLARIGLTDIQVERELRTFFDAVQSELVRLSYLDQSNGGGAA